MGDSENLRSLPDVKTTGKTRSKTKCTNMMCVCVLVKVKNKDLSIDKALTVTCIS